MTDFTADTIKARWQVLASIASHIIPNTLPLEPSPSEVKSVNDDLFLLARHVDALVQAYRSINSDRSTPQSHRWQSRV